ncbi:fumarylacetoacetate hydrolase family protein [Cohnella boryungensis]|uniref:Fumarylacetoacetate hydrolase family protein n=1 Tax=Cohnella boryungensis TaxID=768479 RepID=A0ABV8SBN6_9BACL
MKLLSFYKEGVAVLGIKTDRGIIDVNAAREKSGLPSPTSTIEAVEAGTTAIQQLEALTEHALKNGHSLLAESEIEYAPCITSPGKIICVGLNYRKHADETNAPYPEYPILFNKFENALTGHLAEVTVPKVTNELDYEAELVIVIGQRTKNVDEENALANVFGYCAANDLSARDLQMRTAQWMLGKTCDGFCPLGPYLVTADEVGDPNSLGIRTYVNGELRQNSNTSDMIFRCDELVSYISKHMTLEPGDLILTGTPEGVVLGLPSDRRVYLQPGDSTTVEIDQLGSLTNRFVVELS